MNMHRKATPKGQMSNSGMGPAIANLPIQLKALFEPKPPLEFKPPIVKRKMPAYQGIACLLQEFEKDPPPQRQVSETPLQRKERLQKEKEAVYLVELEQKRAEWSPHDGETRTEDAFKTLFVGRISYDATEAQLRREFEQFGPVKKTRMVNDQDEKSRGYAFIEFEDEADMKVAYDKADGKKIEGRRIVVDVERGRTVKDWKPRRLGGGIGDTRKGSKEVNVRYSGREAISNYSSRGGGGYNSRPSNACRRDYNGGGGYGSSRGAHGDRNYGNRDDGYRSYGGSDRYRDNRDRSDRGTKRVRSRSRDRDRRRDFDSRRSRDYDRR